jgi:hypothetical protein
VLQGGNILSNSTPLEVVLNIRLRTFVGFIREGKASLLQGFGSLLPPRSLAPKALEFAQLCDLDGCKNKQDREH